LIVPHQVSLSIIKKIAKRIKYPLDKISVTLDGLGNIGAASIPIALNIAIKQGRVGPGSRVLLVAGAAGFSAGAILIAL
jgi:3-oxoacyl-[acyl-carrier-protein] synthase III